MENSLQKQEEIEKLCARQNSVVLPSGYMLVVYLWVILNNSDAVKCLKEKSMPWISCWFFMVRRHRQACIPAPVTFDYVCFFMQ